MLQEKMLNLKGKLSSEISKSGDKSVETAKAQHEVGNCAVELHDYKEAEAAYQAALAVMEADSTQGKELQSLLADYAQMYIITTRLKEAEPLLSRACNLGKTLPDVDVQKQRKYMEEYARLLYKLNRTVEADAIYKELRAKP